MTRWRMHRYVRGLRQEARRRPEGALIYLTELQVRVIESGQSFALIPGHEIIGRAVRIERRRARFRNRIVGVFGLHKRRVRV